MNTPNKRVGLLALGALFCLVAALTPLPGQAKTFVENFQTTKNRSKSTTAAWDTKKHQGRLPTTFGSKTWDVTDVFPGYPGFTGSSKKVTLGVGMDERIVRFDGHTFKLVYGPDPNLSFSNGRIVFYQGAWYIGGGSRADEIYKYDGKKVSVVKFPYSIRVTSSVHEMLVGPELFMIDSSGRPLSMKDGKWKQHDQSTSNPTGLPTGVLLSTGAWNAKAGKWLFANYDSSTLYTYNESEGWKAVASPVGTEDWKSIGSNGEQWILGGGLRGSDQDGATAFAYYMFLYDGTTFTDVSPNVTKMRGSFGQFVKVVGWTGKEWVGMVEATPSAYMIVHVSKDGSSIKPAFLNGPSGFYQLYSAGTLAGSNVVLATGMYFLSAEDVHRVYIAVGEMYRNSKTLQSKTIATGQKITKAKLTTKQSTPAETAIQHFLSNDGGRTWTEATRGKTVTFSSAGSKLVWKAVLKTDNELFTPAVTKVQIEY